MPFALEIITRDNVTPTLGAVMRNVSPARVRARIGPAVANLMRRHYLTLPRNKMGGTSTNFWQQASDAVRWETDATGVLVITDKIGVRQRLLGGVIRPVKAKNLAIPANALSYGKTPAEFASLKFVQFGRGQNAPKALVMQTAVATQITPKRGAGKGFKATASELGKVVMYWLVKEVNQQPNPNVIPTDEQFLNTIEAAIAPLANLPKN